MRNTSGGSHALSALVLDANARSALAATRSLGHHGVNVFTADSTGNSLAEASRYSKGYFQIPSPLISAMDFRSAVLALADRLDVKTIFPMVDASVMLLCDASLAGGRPVMATAPLASYVQLSDKGA